MRRYRDKSDKVQESKDAERLKRRLYIYNLRYIYTIIPSNKIYSYSASMDDLKML